jgi:hypothetical protein
MIGRPLRGSLYLGYRSIQGPINSDRIMAAVNYRMSEKWILNAGGAYDLTENWNLGNSVSVTRIGESMLIRLGAHVDRSRDNCRESEWPSSPVSQVEESRKSEECLFRPWGHSGWNGAEHQADAPHVVESENPPGSRYAGRLGLRGQFDHRSGLDGCGGYSAVRVDRHLRHHQRCPPSHLCDRRPAWFGHDLCQRRGCPPGPSGRFDYHRLLQPVRGPGGSWHQPRIFRVDEQNRIINC